MGYLSFQGSAGAPWCVDTWAPDLDGNGPYPMPLKAFQHALGIPTQLYLPYFCPASPYFGKSSNWTSIHSNTSIEGCSDFAFQLPAPAEANAFYRWLFAKGVATGMQSFEPDFLNQNSNCMPLFISSPTAASVWQKAMNDAAAAANVAVQWCYASPTDVLASLALPAVTNFRVSSDFCYGRSYLIGESSLLVYAVGAAPSKDTLWTSINGRFEVPGCPWSPDHEQPGAELHVVLAALSTGPVGISDGLGGTNATLIKRVLTSEGLILRPAKPLTSIDSALKYKDDDRAPSGYVYSTYTGQDGTAADATRSWIFVSFKMTVVFGIGCVEMVATGAGASTILTAPVSDHSNVTGGTDFRPVVQIVYRVCTNHGGALLGALDSYVPLSHVRVLRATCTATGVQATIAGAPDERVSITAIVPGPGSGGESAGELRVQVMEVVFGKSGGSQQIYFGGK